MNHPPSCAPSDCGEASFTLPSRHLRAERSFRFAAARHAYFNVPRPPHTHLSDDTLSQTSRPTSEMWDDTRVHARFSSLAQSHDLTLILTRAGQPAKPKSRYPDRDALASRGQLHPMPSRTKTPELAPWFRRILRAANAVGWGVGCRAGGLKTRSGERKSFVWGPDFLRDNLVLTKISSLGPGEISWSEPR